MDLAKYSISYLLYNFEHIAQIEDTFSELPNDLLLKILSHDNLNCEEVEEETRNLHIVNRWIRHQDNLPMDMETSGKFLSCAKYGSFTSSDLEVVSTLPFILESKICSAVIRTLILKKQGVTLKACLCGCHRELQSPALHDDGCPNCCSPVTHSSGNAEELKNQDTEVGNRCCCSIASRCLFGAKGSKTTSLENFTFDEDTKEIASMAICIPPEILGLADQLLKAPPRSPPFFPCVVGHVRAAAANSGLVFFSLLNTVNFNIKIY